MRIMSVDDSKTIRQTVQQMLEVIGVDFFEAEDGEKAIDLLESCDGDMDLILLDWEMPVMNGFECLSYLKKHEKFKSIPVIMLTSVSQKNNVIDAIRAGAKQYITKPFSSEDLMSKIVHALELA